MDRGKPASEMHILSDANGLPLVVGISAANVHDSEGLKPMAEGHRTRHDPRNYLAFLGLAAALCCYGRLLRPTT